MWGAVGVFGLLVFAIYRLAFRAFAAYEQGLSPLQWVVAGLVCVGMAYTEGYRGFHGSFSPRTAARLRYMRDHPTVARSLLAPLVAMGFFHATRRTRITAYALTFGILILVLLVQRLAQPWRGIIDAGVVVGLGWGTVSLAWWIFRALTREEFDVSPQVPPGAAGPENRHDQG